MTIIDTPPLAINEHDVVAALQRALQATLFTSGLRITPRRVKAVAHELGVAFQACVQQNDYSAARQTGQHLASEGLGHGSVLALVEELHRSSWKNGGCAEASLPASVRYSGGLLEGYMAERESLLLREQERTRVAFDRARTQSNAAPDDKR